MTCGQAAIVLLSRIPTAARARPSRSSRRSTGSIGANLRRTLAGRSLKPFRSTVIGQGISIGKRTAVGEMRGMPIKGFFAWVAWRAIVWQVVPSWDRKLRLLADWAIWPIVGRDIVQMGPSDSAAYDVQHHVYQVGETISDKARPVRLVHVIVEGDVELTARSDETEEVLETIGPGDHFGRKLLEFEGADAARAKTLVRTMALREEQANQLQDVLLSTDRIVARTELLPTIDVEALKRSRVRTQGTRTVRRGSRIRRFQPRAQQSAHHCAWGIPDSRLRARKASTSNSVRRRSRLSLPPSPLRTPYSAQGEIRTGRGHHSRNGSPTLPGFTITDSSKRRIICRWVWPPTGPARGIRRTSPAAPLRASSRRSSRRTSAASRGAYDSPVAELELEPRREALHELAVRGREELRPPLADLDEFPPDLVLRHRHVAQEGRVPVPHDDRATELADSGERLRGLRADDDVPEADELLDSLVLELAQDRVERDAVSVDVRDQSDAHLVAAPHTAISLRSTAPPQAWTAHGGVYGAIPAAIALSPPMPG